MRCNRILPFVPALLCLAAPLHAQAPARSDSDYLQMRAAWLLGRVDAAAGHHDVSRREADRLRLAIRKVQTRAGNLQARNGTITMAEGNMLNRQLTDAERALMHRR